MARPVLAIRWNGLQFYRRRSALGLVRLDRISHELIASPNCLTSESPRADDERRQAKRGERRKVEMDLGPVRYLATLLGADSETVLRWFILVVALLLDPAAALLLSVSARRED